MNKMKVEFLAKSENESFARTVVAAFVLECDPTLSELNDIKTAVSEAVTNAIVHGYNCDESKLVTLEGTLHNNTITLTIHDLGKGIADISKAREPMYTEKPSQERSGMGFTIMEAFMDTIEIKSQIGCGTSITMTKHIGE